MAGARMAALNNRKVSRGFSGRPIPKRGQVKVAIVMGLAHSFASIFSHSNRRAGAASNFSLVCSADKTKTQF